MYRKGIGRLVRLIAVKLLTRASCLIRPVMRGACIRVLILAISLIIRINTVKPARIAANAFRAREGDPWAVDNFRLGQPEGETHASAKQQGHQQQQAPGFQQLQEPHQRWAGPACLGLGRQPVEWWVMLKFPDGDQAAYLDSNMTVSWKQRYEQQQQAEHDDAGGTPSAGELHLPWSTTLGVNDVEGPLRTTLRQLIRSAVLIHTQHRPTHAKQQPEGHPDQPSRLLLQHTGTRAHTITDGDTTRGDASPTGDGASPYSAAPPPPVGYAFYNDADPEGIEHWGYAHSKGALLFGPQGGVWLTHSFPSYPARPPNQTVGPRGQQEMYDNSEAEAYGDVYGRRAQTEWDKVQLAQQVYGQHALCLSLSRKQLLRVVSGLLVARAYAYTYGMPDELEGLYGPVRQLINASTKGSTAGGEGEGGGEGVTGRGGGSSSGGKVAAANGTLAFQRSIRTRGGTKWLHVSKAPNLTASFHEEVLQPVLGAPMAWETWRVGPYLPSQCPPQTKYGSFNVRRIAVPCEPTQQGGRHGGAGGGAGGHDVGDGVDATAAAQQGGSEGLLAESVATGTLAGGVGGGGALSGGARQQIPHTDGSSGTVVASGDGTEEESGGGDDFGGAGGGRGRGGNPGCPGWDSLRDHSKWGISVQQLASPTVATDHQNALGPGGEFPAAGTAAAANAATVKGLGAGAGLIAPATGRAGVGLGLSGGPFTCIGDLNRQASQRVRGGGFVCSGDVALWRAFQSLVYEVEPCAPTEGQGEEGRWEAQGGAAVS